MTIKDFIEKGEVNAENLVTIFNSAFYDAKYENNKIIVNEDDITVYIQIASINSSLLFETNYSLDLYEYLNFGKIRGIELEDVQVHYIETADNIRFGCSLLLFYDHGIPISQIIQAYRRIKKISECVFSKVDRGNR